MKKNSKNNKIELLAKTKFSSIEVLISQTLIDSYIIHDEFASVNQRYKLKEIIKKFLLTGYKFITEMNWRRPEFIYSACGSCTKTKKRMKKKLKKQEVYDILSKGSR